MRDSHGRQLGVKFRKKLARWAVASGVCVASLIGPDAAFGQLQQRTFSPPVHIPPTATTSRDRMARMAAQESNQRDRRLATQEAVVRTRQTTAWTRSNGRQFATAEPPRQQGPDLQQRIAGMFGRKQPQQQPTQARPNQARPHQTQRTRAELALPAVPSQIKEPELRAPQRLAFENQSANLPRSYGSAPAPALPQLNMVGEGDIPLVDVKPETKPIAKRKHSVLNRADRVPLQGQRMEYVEPVQFENEQPQQPEVEYAAPPTIPAFKEKQSQSGNFENADGFEAQRQTPGIQSAEQFVGPPIERQAMLDEFGRPISVLDQPQSTDRQQPAAGEHSPKNQTSQALRSPNRLLNSNRLRRAQPMQSAGFQNRLRQEEQGFQPPTQEPLPNPNRTTGDQELDADLEMLGAAQDDLDDGLGDRFRELSCDEVRAELLGESIRDVALDISPPRVGNSDVGSISRTWTDQYGRILGTGTMVGLSRGYVIIDGSNGRQKISFGRLGDADLAAVAEYWSIPAQCTLGAQPFAERCWTPQTMTWKSSGLCHKPLYFQNVQLERYGHSSGPISQPFYSAVHFFGSLVTLPYQTAIHPPNECRYALGYYRPGNCAPWLRDPLPISLQGIRRQALFSVGLAVLP